MKRTIQAMVVLSLFSGSQAALSFPSSGDDSIPQFQSSYADGYADKGAPAMAFPPSGDEAISHFQSSYADRHADKGAPAMVFPSGGDDVAWAGTSARPEQLARGESDTLSE